MHIPETACHDIESGKFERANAILAVDFGLLAELENTLKDNRIAEIRNVRNTRGMFVSLLENLELDYKKFIGHNVPLLLDAVLIVVVLAEFSQYPGTGPAH